MRYGFVMPGGLDLATIVRAGVEAEAAGWDAIFYWDGIVPGARGFDPWVALAAIAGSTKRVLLGAVLVPLPWRKPWLVARALGTLDQLSNGRVVLPVGLGAVHDPEIVAGETIVGEPVDIRRRAELLDEGLEIVDGLAAGGPFSYEGSHYRLRDVEVPAVVQRPRVPIWVVGAWGSGKSMRRALQYDGWLPARVEDSDLPAVNAYLAKHRPSDRPFEVCWAGSTPGEDRVAAVATVQRYADAGATFWIESMWMPPNAATDVLRRIAQGPPRI
jgi:alkanesulfonate monooxygenase SsuD/methylene tetrahydromethanopterin reductase-like flavin-dependent oxidoreductase (luciferase family)